MNIHRLSRLAFFLVRVFCLGSDKPWGQIALYWIAKIGGVIIALAISLALTTFWEERVIAHFAKKKMGDAFFFESVLKANLVTFFFISVIGAIYMIPKRLASDNFMALVREIADMLISLS